MSLLPPKAIVITAFGTKGANSFTVANMEEVFADGGGQPRKRKRLTHLSADEKILRRKLKNRVAAQTARDRKKALMVDLEEKVAQLQAQNRQLMKENAELRISRSSLQEENCRLKKCMTKPAATPTVNTKTSVSLTTTDASALYCKTEPDSTGSAAPVVSLPKEQLQSDALLSLLQQLTAEGGGVKPQTQTDASGSTTFAEFANVGADFGEVPQNTGLVGPTATELESLNELIKFDHIYYKEEPSSPSVSSNSNSSSSSNTVSSGMHEPSLLQPFTVKKELELSARPKLVSCSQVPVTTCATDVGSAGSSVWDSSISNMELLLPNVENGLGQSVPQPIETNAGTKTVAEVPHDMDCDMGYDPSAEFLDFESLLGMAELETSEIFLKDPALHNGQQAQQHQVHSEPQHQIMNMETHAVVMQDKTATRKRKHTPSPGSSPLTHKSGICNSERLSPSELSVYEDAPQEQQSDSGIGSDLSDVPSPNSDISSMLGDDTWEESFTELFPSLL